MCDSVVKWGMAANRADLPNTYTHLHTHIDTRQNHTLHTHCMRSQLHNEAPATAMQATTTTQTLCVCVFSSHQLWQCVSVMCVSVVSVELLWCLCLINPWSQCSISTDLSLPSLRQGLLCCVFLCIQCVYVCVCPARCTLMSHCVSVCWANLTSPQVTHILAHLFDHSNCSKAVESLMG